MARAPQNPMAVLAYRVLDEAVRAVRTADALAAVMEPYLQKRYGNSAIYAYTNERAVPPGDVLLAAALAAGISLDERLGVGREPTDAERQMDELRAELATVRDQVAALQERVGGPERSTPERAAQDAQDARADRRARRRDWARRSAASQPVASPPAGRPSGRARGI